MSESYTPDDITMVIGLRAHDGNPWALSRLELMARHYDPLPNVLVVDLGSPERYVREVRRVCEDTGLRHLPIDDTGIFSQSIARNAGAARVQTDLIFFNDIDCLGESDLFSRLVRLVNALQMRRWPEQLISLPAYHLTHSTTQRILSSPRSETNLELTSAMVLGVDSPMGDVVEYVDPFSNIFLCHRDLFSLSGGYDEGFRGHGSEDYELMIRLLVVAGQYPLPPSLSEDVYGPTRPEFFGPKAFRGFRRLGELAAYQAETSGCRVAHLYHPRSDSADWYRNNDWKRHRFEAAVSETTRDWTSLLRRDWLPRERRASAIIGRDSQAHALLRLRLLGCSLEPLVVSPGEELASARRLLEENRISTVGCVRPASATDSEVAALREKATAVGAELHLIDDRVASPNPRRFSGSSYAAARLGVHVAVDRGHGMATDLPEEVFRRVPPHVAAEPAAKRTLRKVRKLWNDPERFLSDARSPALRWLGRRMRRG